MLINKQLSGILLNLLSILKHFHFSHFYEQLVHDVVVTKTYFIVYLVLNNNKVYKLAKQLGIQESNIVEGMKLIQKLLHKTKYLLQRQND